MGIFPVMGSIGMCGSVRPSAEALMFRATVPAATVINRLSKFWPGHYKQCNENHRFWS